MNTKRNIYKTVEHPFAQYVRILGKGKQVLVRSVMKKPIKHLA
jgi:hypothetical protein